MTVRVEEAPGGPFRIALRVPAWAGGATLADGDGRRPVPAGYAAAQRAWRPGDELRLELPLAARWTRPDPRIDAVRGCVAAERGPLVYCVESLAAGAAGRGGGVELDGVAVDASAPPAEAGRDGGLGGAVTLTCSAHLLPAVAAGWPYAGEVDGAAAASGPATPLTMIPYHLWANRGPAAMRVWLPAAP